MLQIVPQQFHSITTLKLTCATKKLKSLDPTKEIDLTDFPAERIRNFSIIAHIGMALSSSWVCNITRHCNQTFYQQTMEKVHLLTGQYFYIQLFGMMPNLHWGHNKLMFFISYHRLLELTRTIRDQGSNKQVLDKLKVERERGITVKAQVSLGIQKSCIHIVSNLHYLG